MYVPSLNVCIYCSMGNTLMQHYSDQLVTRDNPDEPISGKKSAVVATAEAHQVQNQMSAVRNGRGKSKKEQADGEKKQTLKRGYMVLH